MADANAFPVTGVIPPERAEAPIREVYPSVARIPAIAGIGRALTKTIVLAPLAWLLMSLAYFSKVLPIFMRRYRVTNRRLQIRKGWSGKVSESVPLEEIDEVVVVPDSNSDFFRAGTLEILHGKEIVLRLRGVPEPYSFRWAILNARNAWVPGKASTLPFISAASAK
jgi:hypothetical protein